MPESGYWTSLERRIGRRTLLRGAALGVAGIAGAALIGCGDDEGDAPSGGGGSGSGGGTSQPGGAGTSGPSGNGAPANVTRALGFDPSAGFGSVPINDREVVPGGVFRTPTTSTSVRDPELSPGAGPHGFVNDRLFIANGWTSELIPDLLESYEVRSPEEIILTLREGIKTHDKPPVSGRIFNAEDVVWSIHRKAGLLPEGDPGRPELLPIRASHFTGLERAEAVDERTVRLVMSSPNGSILKAFTHSGGVMYPREQGEMGWVDPMKFVGTGAWIQTEYVDGTRQVFKANPDYYRSWDEGGRPGYDTYEIIVLPDRASMIAAFINGEVNELTGGGGALPTEEPAIRSAVPDALWYEQLNVNWTYFAMNANLPHLPFFKDQRVRRAMQLSHDYAALGEGFAQSYLYTGPITVYFPEGLSSDEVKKLPGYNPDTKEQDIAEAQQLLAGAGYPEGEGITFKYEIPGASGAYFDLAVRMKEHWSRIFPRMVANLSTNADTADFTNLMNTKTYEARNWGNAIVPDAALEARQYFHSEGSRNFEGFAEPWADEAIEKMLAAQSLEERIDAIRPFEDRYLQEGPGLLPLHVPGSRFPYQSTTGGVDLASGTFAVSGGGTIHRWLWQTKPA